MKKLVDLIEIEKAFIKESEKVDKLYAKKTQDYIANTKDQIATLQSEIVNKATIVSKQLSEHTVKKTAQSSTIDKNIDTQKIKEIILSQL